MFSTEVGCFYFQAEEEFVCLKSHPSSCNYISQSNKRDYLFLRTLPDLHSSGTVTTTVLAHLCCCFSATCSVQLECTRWGETHQGISWLYSVSFASLKTFRETQKKLSWKGALKLTQSSRIPCWTKKFWLDAQHHIRWSCQNFQARNFHNLSEHVTLQCWTILSMWIFPLHPTYYSCLSLVVYSLGYTQRLILGWPLSSLNVPLLDFLWFVIVLLAVQTRHQVPGMFQAEENKCFPLFAGYALACVA